MAINREAARDAGYSDAEIDQFEAEESKKSAPPPAVETAKIDAEEPPPPTTVVPEVEHSMSNVLLGEAAIGLGDLGGAAKNVAIPVGEGILAYKGIQAYKEASAAKNAASAAAQATAAAQAQHTALQQQKFAAQQAARGAPVQPAANPIVDAQGRPLAQQAARGAAPSMAPQAAPTAQNFIQRMAALGKQYAPAAARIGTGIGAMLYSPSLGPEVPETGPLRGSELNPKTHRLWTKEELAQYNQFYR